MLLGFTFPLNSIFRFFFSCMATTHHKGFNLIMAQTNPTPTNPKLSSKLSAICPGEINFYIINHFILIIHLVFLVEYTSGLPLLSPIYSRVNWFLFFFFGWHWRGCLSPASFYVTISNIDDYLLSVDTLGDPVESIYSWHKLLASFTLRNSILSASIKQQHSLRGSKYYITTSRFCHILNIISQR